MNSLLIEQIKMIIDDSLPPISNISNILALLFYELDDVNWVGLYACDDQKKECTLGPFQGRVACTRIAYRSGVVGTCADTRQTMLINNVHEFAGHIACDVASQSELVVPLIHADRLLAVLDIDSPTLNHFNTDIKETMEAIAPLLARLLAKQYDL